MDNPIYGCSNVNCANAIATDGLNSVKLEALRRWARTCDRCEHRTIWHEKVLLLNTEPTQKLMEGKQSAKNKKSLKENQENVR